MAPLGVALMSFVRPSLTFKTTKPTAMAAVARTFVTIEKAATSPANRVQIFVSRTHDPYVNLSFEHFLLSKTPEDSTVLFLYTNRPSIIIGRNQNPWQEVNIGLLKKKLGATDKVDLVRRRSGGGTVFHDEGNMNYSVVFPTAVFDRDAHALMVVRALNSLGVSQAKVNERHDIVVVQKSKGVQGETVNEAALPLLEDKPLKISGSAYKVTRKRALHHGTCLLSSKHLAVIGKYLKSPAAPYISSFGTPSVRSPITNVRVDTKKFEQAVVAEFKKLYGEVKVIEVTDFDAARVEAVRKYHEEQKSEKFTWQMTPKFSFSSKPTEEHPDERPALPANITKGTNIQFSAKHGEILESFVCVVTKGGFTHEYNNKLVGVKINEIKDWNDVLTCPNAELKPLADWMNSLFV